MAGFFGFFDYTKPGPGIPKDAPPKPPIVVFFGIYTRKFWNLVKINLMFNLFNLPAMLLAIYPASFFIFNEQVANESEYELIVRFIYMSIVLCIPLITVGPAQAGFTYILRNYSREEHAFLWWDFKDNALLNFKQASIISIIDYLAVILFGIVINFYFKYPETNSTMAMFIVFARTIMLLAFVVYLMMHMYIYPMLVTFKLSIRQLYKNAFIFAMAKFFPNLGIMLLCVALILISFYVFPVGIILYLFITVSTIGLITNFYVYSKIKKYMIDVVESEEDEEDEESEEGEEGEVEEQAIIEEKQDENPEPN